MPPRLQTGGGMRYELGAKVRCLRSDTGRWEPATIASLYELDDTHLDCGLPVADVEFDDGKVSKAYYMWSLLPQDRTRVVSARRGRKLRRKGVSLCFHGYSPTGKARYMVL